MRMDKPQIICHLEKSVNFSVFDARWIPCSAKFVVLGSHPNGSGALQIYEINGTEVTLIREVEKGKALKCGTFGASSLKDRHLATGDFEGKLQIWNLEDFAYPVYSVKAHKEIINCIDGIGGQGICRGAPEIVTGSRDGMVKVWDPRLKEVPVATMEPAEGEATRDCWSVSFGNSYNVSERAVCAGYDNGDIKLFDLRQLSVIWEANLKNGVCSVEFDRKDIQMNKLVATTLESKFYVFDLHVQHPKQGYPHLMNKAHKSTIWTCKHLPQNREVFMTCGGSGSLCLWKYNYPQNRIETDGDGLKKGVIGTAELLQNVTLSTQPIASFDWSPDKLGLAVCTGLDQAFRVLITTKLNLL
ncbi:dynein axonemal assembly factor 10 [Hetaerina americana]|uniref:dynein axonemal assembly factor 10 n=1 Tax=Hetaerina americana TaxID=62018 RepID=UPI003A7F3800